MATSEILKANQSLAGFIKIWKTDPDTGESFLIVDKPNLILKGGAKILAQTLGGNSSYNIWGMYIGYNNTASFTAPNIDIEYSNTFAARADASFGYLREPITFTPTFSSSSGYDSNTVLFSTMITSATRVAGALFNSNSRIYEVALIAAPSVNDVSKDVVFSRTNFNPILYDNTYNFTVTWGVRILLP